MNVIKSLKDAIDMSIEHQGDNEYYHASFTVKVDGKNCKVHEISICNRDILCWSDKGTISYLDGCLFDWEFDDA